MRHWNVSPSVNIQERKSLTSWLPINLNKMFSTRTWNEVKTRSGASLDQGRSQKEKYLKTLFLYLQNQKVWFLFCTIDKAIKFESCSLSERHSSKKTVHVITMFSFSRFRFMVHAWCSPFYNRFSWLDLVVIWWKSQMTDILAGKTSFLYNSSPSTTLL